MELISESIYLQFLKGVIFGLLLGLIPLFIAHNRGCTKTGIWAVVLCSIASSFFGPVPAMPISAIFTIVASLKEQEKATS